MATLEDLQKEIEEIKTRNSRVEVDKTWETSKTRRALFLTFTYLAISLYMNAVSLREPWLNAIIPTMGFFLSTLTLPSFKSLWEKYIRKS